ncbi:hypothetical protein NW759_014884 [Fusarium solani]|nr:hypothetical protein NW759_014884 [Fusarium solani]
MNDPGARTFGLLCYLALRSAIVTLEADIFLHYTYLADPPMLEPGANATSNVWIQRLEPYITLVYHAPETLPTQRYTKITSVEGGAGMHYAHVADILRLQLLREGGIYLDIDVLALRPFTDLLHGPRDVIMGHEGGNRAGLCNAVILARPNATFIQRWLDSYYSGASHGGGTGIVDLSQEWNEHSVILPKKMEQEHPDEICALAPDAFFWPTWTWHHSEWMHEPLPSLAEAQQWAAEIEANGGAISTSKS